MLNSIIYIGKPVNHHLNNTESVTRNIKHMQISIIVSKCVMVIIME